MELVEEDILSHLKAVNTTSGYADLLVASRIIDSQALYQQALQALVELDPELDLNEAKRIGVEAYHAVVSARTRIPLNHRVWIHCPAHVSSWGCTNCHEYRK